MPSRRRRAASRVPGLRRSGFAQAGRPVVVLTYSVYAPLRHNGRALRDVVNHTAALPEEWHVLACTGWAGETGGLFEQPPFPLTLAGVRQWWKI